MFFPPSFSRILRFVPKQPALTIYAAFLEQRYNFHVERSPHLTANGSEKSHAIRYSLKTFPGFARFSVLFCFE
jgi:hypothetical protein